MDQIRRRDSILKPESGDATPTKTTTKNKRISFSGKNSVKEFIEGNDKHTIWGTSYEKEMEAMQKQGDSMVPSQIDLSTYDSAAAYCTLANKENLPDMRGSNRVSYALLECERVSNSICPNMDVTALHMLPGDSLGSDTVVGQIFQLQASHVEQMARVADGATTANHNNTAAMEVSMMWQDIMTQTKEAGGFNKTSSRMGNAINLIPDAESTRVTLARQPRQTINYNGLSDGDMEIEKTMTGSAASQRTIYYQSANDDMDESGFKRPIEANAHQRSAYGNMDQSVMMATHKNRQTIHFNNENLDESSRQTMNTPGDYVKIEQSRRNPHQTIHFQSDGSAMEESVLEVTKCTATRGRDSYFPGGNNDLQREKELARRQTILYAADGGAMDESVRDQQMHVTAHFTEMEESIVVDQRQTLSKKSRDSCFIVPENKENLQERGRTTRGMAAKTRQTIHYPGDEGRMDETQRHCAIVGDHSGINVKKNPRQTIVFKEGESAMDESTVGCPRVDEIEREKRMLMEQKADQTKLPRHTTYFNENDGMIEESVRYPIQAQMQSKKSRQSIHFNELNGEMDESVQIPAPIAQLNRTGRVELAYQMKNPRQTICFKPDEGQMDESVQHQLKMPINATENGMEQNPQAYYTNDEHMEVEENTPQKISARRETVYFQAHDGNMDESHVIGGPAFIPKPVHPGGNLSRVVDPKSRQTVYYQGEDNNLDETKVEKPAVEKRARRTIYDDGGMDVSLTDYGQNSSVQPPPVEPRSTRSTTRQTVYYQNDGLDVSCAPPGPDRLGTKMPEHGAAAHSRRGTIYYNQTGMEESIVVAPRDKSVIQSAPVRTPAPSKNRQTIHFNNVDDAEMDESRTVPGMDKPMGPLERSMKMQNGNKSGSVQSPLERSLLLQQSRKENVAEQPQGQSEAVAQKTIYYQHENDMEESMQGPRISDTSAYYAALTAASRPQRETVYSAATMEESLRIPNIRRGTFNVPKEDSVMVLGKYALSSTMRNSTAFEIVEDSIVSDLNNLEDSVELIDSSGNPQPVNSVKYGNRLSCRSSKSPDLVNETVNDLNLNFNVTGQIILSKEKLEEPSARNASKIPVRTPSKKKSMGSDMSVVDVARDASVIVPRSRFCEEEFRRECTFVDAIKPNLRMSIPVFAANNKDVSMDQQAMAEMPEMAETEVAKVMVERRPNRGRIERRVDVKIFKGIDFGAAIDEIKDLSFKVHKVCNTILTEQSMYIPHLGSEISLKQKTFEEANAQIARRIGDLSEERDRGCFPLCLPMEDMLKNLVESEHKSWRYQDLYYHMGFLKFRHRLVKTFQVVIKFSTNDDEFSREHYLPFERFRIVEDDLSHWSTVDQAMHVELMRSMPLGLVSLYGNSIDLGRFLEDVDQICRRIFKDIAF